MSKCKALDRYSNQCILTSLDNIDYCKFHEYLLNYDDEQLNNLQLCKGCLKWKFLDDDVKTCNECKTRGKENRIKTSNNKILCKKDGCKFKKSNDNEYCGKHQACYFKEQTENEGKKVCYNYLRGCREQLNKKYSFLKCQKCLIIDRKNDKIRRSKNKILDSKDDENKTVDDVDNNKIVDNDVDDVNDNKNNNNISNSTIVKNDEISKIIENVNNNIEKYEKKINKIMSYLKYFMNEDGNFIKFNLKTSLIQCSDAKCKLPYPESCFISDTDGSITKRCQNCRNKGKIKDHKMSRQKSKQKWKEENHNKLAEYWMDYRGRKMEELGEEYWKKNAEQAKKWRENNPDKVKEINQKKKENVKAYYKIYQDDASNKNLPFEITLEQYLELVVKPCFYCGIIQNKGFNGIDKKVCTDGYILDNTVSCCSMCNVIKGTLTPEIFFKRIEHILTYQKIIKGNLHLDIFKNYKYISYNSYKNRAIENLKVDFKISKEEFEIITIDKCYLCGKETNETHKNGIDRIDNNLGYIKTNIKSCCGNCNYMKNKFDLEELLTKILQIFKNLKNYEFNDNKIILNSLVYHLDKKSSNEKNKSLEEKRKIQKENMIIKYNNEEYKKNRANELALLRK